MKINKDLKRTLLVSASALMFLSVGGAVNANVHADDTSFATMFNYQDHDSDKSSNPYHMDGNDRPNKNDRREIHREAHSHKVPSQFFTPTDSEGDTMPSNNGRDKANKHQSNSHRNHWWTVMANDKDSNHMSDPEHMFGGHPNHRELNREKREGRHVNPNKFIIPTNEKDATSSNTRSTTSMVHPKHHKKFGIYKLHSKRSKRSWAQRIYRKLSRLKRQIKIDRTKLTHLHHRSKRGNRIRKTLRKYLAQRRHLTRQLRNNDNVKRNASLIRKYRRALKRPHKRSVKNRYRRAISRLNRQNKKLNHQLKH